MPALLLAKHLLHRIRSDRPTRWWDTFAPSIVREEGGAVVLDTAHAAYVKAAGEFGPLFQWQKPNSNPSSREAGKPNPAASLHHDPRSRLWLELHRRPVESPDLGKESQWLTPFAGRIPCGDCRRHWKELLAQTPPAFESWSVSPDGRLAYAKWTWTIHNAVNALLKKPQISWEQAVVLQGWQSLVALPTDEIRPG
jgi:hypothetical protein